MNEDNKKQDDSSSEKRVIRGYRILVNGEKLRWAQGPLKGRSVIFTDGDFAINALQDIKQEGKEYRLQPTSHKPNCIENYK